MKLTTILLILSLVKIQASSYSQNTKLSLKFKEATVEQVFNKIESVSEYRFLFESNQIDLNRKVNFNVEKQKIDDILSILFKGTNTAYYVNDRQIILKKEKEVLDKETVSDSKKTAQQGILVTGVITDVNNMPVPGVNVLEKGTKNGIQSDFDGKFSIRVNGSSSALVFSFIGYETVTKVVGQNKTMNIVLKDESSTLNEVVVIGYGTAKKGDLTGSVAAISGDDLKKTNMNNVAESLTGRVAGVQVTSAEGSPDADIKIRIRGGGSLTQDASPLVIVDGFPVSSLNDIAPSDIETITVLKDASSTAIYGSRGANGVILVTTKKGKDGKISVSFNTYYGLKKIASTIDVLKPEEYVKLQYEFVNRFDADDSSYQQYFGQWGDRDLYSGMKGNNWQKQIYGRLGETRSRDLGIRGGTDKMNFNFNYAHIDEKTIMLGSQYKRNNLSFSVKNKASEKIDLSFTMRYSDTQINGGGTNEQNAKSVSADARLRHSVGYSPIPLPGLTTDNTDEAVAGYLVNPFVAVADNDRLQNRKNFNLLGGISYKILPGLQLGSDLGLDNYYLQDYRFYGRSTYYVNNQVAAENQGKPALAISDTKNVRFRIANTANYDFKKIIGEDHSLKLLLGQELIKSNSTELASEINGFPLFFGFESAKNLSSQGVALFTETNYAPEDKLLSYFGRLTYDYKNRYLFTATYRADGSSKFLGKNRWGYFPSAALAWKLSEEDFLKNVGWLKLLKVRASYGQAGNNNIPSGQTSQLYSSSTTTWINGITNYWSASKVLANPDLKWETTVTQNFGLDYELFNGKLSGSVEAYKNVTKDLLINFPVPGTGYDTQYRNMGETQNTGVEATLSVTAINKPNYGLSFSLNFGMNKNRINSLGIMSDFGVSTAWASTAIGNDYVVRVGQPLGLMYGYKSDGRYEVSDFDYNGTSYTLRADVANATAVVGTVSPGVMKLKDLNNDGKVDANDQTIIGNANPKHTGGFVINANAYGFDLSAAFNYSFGNDIYNANKVEFTTATTNTQYRNLSLQMASDNRWTNFNAAGELVTDPVELQTLNANTTLWSPFMSRYVFSDWAVEDGSFIRLNTLSLGYTVPADALSKYGISKLRFYATANNVFVITKYSGLDPEVSTIRRTPLTPGVDYSPFPRSRQVSFGLNLNF
ncbi:TonB-linked outer membrane protein, SusC/RagA family [Flavobacterium glycines]|nr:TonB-linked outer membrane protein, SusC/RagA family [Flavobacterium glycines]